MDTIQLVSVILFALNLYQAKGCQEPWELFVNSERLDDSSMIRYKNITTNGKKEWLSFSWKGGPEEIWNLDLLYLLKRDKIEGKIHYRKSPDEEVMIPWVIENKEISSMVSSKKIFGKPWVFLLCDRLDIAFSTDEGGNWKIQIDEFLLQRASMDAIVNERQKRSEEFYEETTNTTSYQPPRGFGFMDDVYDYFFGDEDPSTGRRAGIFVRMKNWMRDMACRLGIACEGPSPPIYVMPPPTQTPPPADPDAETITEDSSQNDVYQK